MSLNEINFCYLIISGVPGIGKTTFCKAFDDYMCKNENSIDNKFKFRSLLISYDEIINKQIENELINKNESEWKSSRSLIQTLVHLLAKFLRENVSNLSKFKDEFESNVDSLATSLQNNLRDMIKTNFLNSIVKQLSEIQKKDSYSKVYYIIILDDIFYYESMRHLYFKLAFRQEFSSYFCLSFKTENFEFVLQRNNLRDKDAKIEESTLRNIYSKFEYPREIEWEREFSDLINIQENVEYNKNFFENLVESLLANHSKFIKYKEKKNYEEKIKAQNFLDGQKSCQNLIHECDLILRKLVKEKISDAGISKTDLKKMVEKLNRNKNKIFENIKNQNSDLYFKVLALDDLNKIEQELRSYLFNDL